MRQEPQHSQRVITGKLAQSSPLESDPRAVAEYEVNAISRAIFDLAEKLRDPKVKQNYLAQFERISAAHHDLSKVVEQCWRDTPSRQAAE